MAKNTEPRVHAEQRTTRNQVAVRIVGIGTDEDELSLQIVTGDERGHWVLMDLPFEWLLRQRPEIYASTRN